MPTDREITNQFIMMCEHNETVVADILGRMKKMPDTDIRVAIGDIRDMMREEILSLHEPISDNMMSLGLAGEDHRTTLRNFLIIIGSYYAMDACVKEVVRRLDENDNIDNA